MLQRGLLRVRREVRVPPAALPGLAEPTRVLDDTIQRDVLAWPAAEVAQLLDMSVAAVKSALQRARARLAEVAPVADHVTTLTEPEHRELLDRYIAAFQNADAAALERLLVKDATLEAPPLRTWYAGIRFCMPYMAAHVLGSPGHWRMLPASANGQPAVAAYYRGSDGSYLPYGIVVLTATAAGHLAHYRIRRLRSGHCLRLSACPASDVSAQ